MSSATSIIQSRREENLFNSAKPDCTPDFIATSESEACEWVKNAIPPKGSTVIKVVVWEGKKVAVQLPHILKFCFLTKTEKATPFDIECLSTLPETRQFAVNIGNYLIDKGPNYTCGLIEITRVMTPADISKTIRVSKGAFFS